MSKICELTGKKAITGHHVSFSNHKTKRKFNVNLKVRTFVVPETGETVTLKISTSAMRTVTKNGIYATLKQAREKGYTKK